MSEVLEGCSELQVGDEVEFVGVKKRQTGKYSAFNLRKIRLVDHFGVIIQVFLLH